MALILNLETATKVCSVALGKDGSLLALKEYHGEYSHAEKLTVFVEEILKEAGLKLSDLDAIAISKGPGSYTGLRIGVSTAKGFCFALDKPLIAISTLQSMANKPSLKENTGNVLLCPMIDARRMEVYCAFYNMHNNLARDIAAEIIDEHSFEDILQKYKVIFLGDGAEKCKAILSQHQNAIFADNVFPSATDMITLSESAFHDKQFEDVAYFEPYYLKDFVTTTPKKKI